MREWTLGGGVPVLVDNGHCLIDGFDMMDDTDLRSIHGTYGSMRHAVTSMRDMAQGCGKGWA